MNHKTKKKLKGFSKNYQNNSIKDNFKAPKRNRRANKIESKFQPNTF